MSEDPRADEPGDAAEEDAGADKECGGTRRAGGRRRGFWREAGQVRVDPALISGERGKAESENEGDEKGIAMREARE